MTRKCPRCRTSFEVTRPHKTYCSRRCQNATYAKRCVRVKGDGALPQDSHTPLEWNGRTIYTPQPALVHTFEAHCCLCGEVESFRATDAQLRRMPPRYCQRCGGRMFAERQDIGSIHGTYGRGLESWQTHWVEA